MTRSLLSAVLATLVGAPVAAQTTTGSGATRTAPSTNLMTLSGCVTPADKLFTLKDEQGGETYSLTGINGKEFAGKRVELRAVQSSSRLKIKGGLYPNANVAAQAGAIDPSRAAIAAQSGPTANTPRPPIEIRVRSVRTIGGECPDPAPNR
jgi:hypothetical protein